MSDEQTPESKKKKGRTRKRIRMSGTVIYAPRGLSRDGQSRWYADMLDRKAKAEAGIEPLIVPIQVEDYAAKWMKKRAAAGKPKSSSSVDEQRLRLHILPRVPRDSTPPMHLIQSPRWREILADIERNPYRALKDGTFAPAGRPLAKATFNRIRALLRKMYHDAMQENPPHVANNPISQIAPYKERTYANEPDFYSVEECHAYLRAAKALSRLHWLIAMIYINTGVRKAEAIAWQWSDINFGLGRIKVSKIVEQVTGQVVRRTKAGGASERYLGINKALRKALLEWREATLFNRPDDFVIHSPEGQRMNAYFINREHERIEKKAGVRHIRVHDLRHTYGSHYVMNGGDVKDLKFLFGHSSELMTNRYVHLAPGYLENKASRVNFDIEDNDNVIDLAHARGGAQD